MSPTAVTGQPTFCAALTSLAQQSASEPAPDLPASLVRSGVSGEPTCAQAPVTGTPAHCRWEFPYRDPAAAEAFEGLKSLIEGCLEPDAQILDDAAVNHPDSYDLLQYRAGDVTVAVSSKDKATLNKTFVFLRLFREGG
jgi:hypothetical protein